MAELKPCFRDVVGFEGLYKISDTGIVFSVRTNKELKPFVTQWGYLSVQLRNHSKKANRFVHRLVGEAFLEKPEDATEINHKDGNKKNNHVSNLEWCTSSQNHSHRCHVLGEKPTNIHIMHQKNSKRVVCIETGDVFKSITDASKSVGVGLSTMSAHLNGKTRICAGLHWRYEERNDGNDA